MKKIGWFDIKAEVKYFVRSFFYTKFGQEITCYLVIAYIKLVHFTSKKIIVDDGLLMERLKNNQPVIIVSWHHQIMMAPFVADQIRKFNRINKIASLASKHGDGRFVGRMMEKFGIINVSGSSRDGRKAGRGIDIHGLKEIFRSIKNHLGIAITPDGPRGPSKKINGEVIKIAKLSGAPIVPASICYSKFFEMKTWDRFQIPLPFGAICYYYGALFFVDKNIKDEEIPQLNLMLEEKINLVSSNASELANKN